MDTIGPRVQVRVAWPTQLGPIGKATLKPRTLLFITYKTLDNEWSPWS